MPRTPCRIHPGYGDCGHSCNAFCVEGTHADVTYTDREISDAKALAELTLVWFLKDRPMTIVSVERAKEAPRLSECSNQHQYPEDKKGVGVFPYLFRFTGCPVPCPQSREHEGREEESDG